MGSSNRASHLAQAQLIPAEHCSPHGTAASSHPARNTVHHPPTNASQQHGNEPVPGHPLPAVDPARECPSPRALLRRRGPPPTSGKLLGGRPSSARSDFPVRARSDATVLPPARSDLATAGGARPVGARSPDGGGAWRRRPSRQQRRRRPPRDPIAFYLFCQVPDCYLIMSGLAHVIQCTKHNLN